MTSHGAPRSQGAGGCRWQRVALAPALLAPFGLLAWAGPTFAESPPQRDGRLDRSRIGLQQGEAKPFRSAFFDGAELVVLPGVFEPTEAEEGVLPFMRANRERFEGRSVLEIGTGTGIIGAYAARLGAARVVATDISEAAIENASRNAERLGFGDVIELRLVPQTDPSAYSVIGPGETFDVIVSNPPYSLDLAADENSAVTDRGDLGFSIVRGLDAHLKPGGVAMLLYGSLFYHQVMVKFARHSGFVVRDHTPFFLSLLEAETLFNAYLARLLEHEGLEPDALRFDVEQDASLSRIRVAKTPAAPPALLPGNPPRWYHGMIVIQRE